MLECITVSLIRKAAASLDTRARLLRLPVRAPVSLPSAMKVIVDGTCVDVDAADVVSSALITRLLEDYPDGGFPLDVGLAAFRTWMAGPTAGPHTSCEDLYKAAEVCEQGHVSRSVP
jgi:hypothetical protein